MNSDLERERAQASFPVQQLTDMLYGGKEKYKRVLELRKVVQSNPVFRNDDYYFGSRSQRFSRALEKAVELVKIQQKLALHGEDIRILKSCVREEQPLALHWVMFMPTIEGQGTPEQVQYWMPLATSMKIIGTYAQTELGHGTYVQGIETTATYDPKMEQFIINSPTLTSTKWWPGSLGKISTHVNLVARLVTHGKDYGPHSFIVQIRDLETHLPLKGVTVGDIGPKFGYDTMDNGFLRFDHVAIPRTNMLMKHAQVAKDGSYTKPAHAKLGYGTMIFVRAHMALDGAKALKFGTTIAVRYSIVRHQSKIEPDGGECSVLEFIMQQYQLFPLLARAYAYHFTGTSILALFERMKREVSRGEFGLLAEIHASTSGLKSLVASTASEGLEVCRRCCGGHGYSKFSGFADYYANYTPASTYEGENVVMFLQCARYLVKCCRDALEAKPLYGSVIYLAQRDPDTALVSSAEDLRHHAVQIALFEARARNLVSKATQLLQSRVVKNGESKAIAWNNCAVELVAAATAHCELYVLYQFVHSISQPEIKEAPYFAALSRLASLYALQLVELHPSQFPSHLLPETMVPDVALTVRALLAEIRPDALALVDAFALDDHFLNSALGRYDGDVYTHLYRMAQMEPLNQEPVHDAVKQFLLPLKKASKL